MLVAEPSKKMDRSRYSSQQRVGAFATRGGRAGWQRPHRTENARALINIAHRALWRRRTGRPQKRNQRYPQPLRRGHDSEDAGYRMQCDLRQPRVKGYHGTGSRGPSPREPVSFLNQRGSWGTCVAVARACGAPAAPAHVPLTRMEMPSGQRGRVLGMQGDCRRAAPVPHWGYHRKDVNRAGAVG
jgi:hypothetical protein